MAQHRPDEDRPRQELLFELQRLRKELEVASRFLPNVQGRSGAQELAHLRSIHRIHEAALPESDLEGLLDSLVDEVRRVFDADQAFLCMPCVADTRPRQIPCFRSRSGSFPALDAAEGIAVEPELMEMQRALLGAGTPLAVPGPGGVVMPEQVRRVFGAQSGLATVLHLPDGDPWILILHQCSFARVWASEDIRLLKDVSRVMTGALSNVLLRQNLEDSKKRLQNLSAQLFRAGEEDRKQFAREIHDDLGQPLVAIKVGLDNALYDLDDDIHIGLKRWLVSAAGLAKSLVDRVRMMQDAMYPAALQDFGPLVALDAFVNNYKQIYPGLEVNKVVLVQESDIPEGLGTILFRIVQEALYNAAKHSCGDTVSVALDKRDGRLRLAVRDNGKGFDLAAVGPTPGCLTGLGLPSMQERTEMTGGTFSIHSAQGKGTFIQIEWPLAEG